MTEQANETPALPEEGTPDADAVDQATTAADPARLRQERDDHYDRLLRLTAEFDNYRKRVERERRETFERAAASIPTEASAQAVRCARGEVGTTTIRGGYPSATSFAASTTATARIWSSPKPARSAKNELPGCTSCR